MAEAGAEVDVTQLVDIARATRNEARVQTCAGRERRSERSVRRVPPTARSDGATWPEDLPRPRGFCRRPNRCTRAFEFLRSLKHRSHLATILSEHAATYERIRKADAVGAFQIESRAQMSMLPRMAPKRSTILLPRLLASGPGLSRRYGASFSAPEEGKEPVEFTKSELVGHGIFAEARPD